MKTTDAVRGHWDQVFAYYNLPPITGKRHFTGECPICGKKGKYRNDNHDGNGTFICTCNQGDGWKLLQLTQGKDFKTLAPEVDRIIGNSYHDDGKKELSDADKLRIRVIKKFNALPVIKDTDAEAYLKNRQITPVHIQNVKFCKKDQSGSGFYSAIYSIATDNSGNPCYIHRTFLDGDKKAPITTPKKMNSLQNDTYLEFAQSVAVRLFPVASTIGIAEGIETALSCHQIYKCNTWSALNASILRKFRAPDGVEHLIIFADSDKNGAGHAAAFECAHRNILAKNSVQKVSVRWLQLGDFNDMLVNGGEVFEWVLSK